MRQLWKPILDEFKVDLVLSGHDHTYSRTGLIDPKSIKNIPTGYKQAYDPNIGTVHVVSVSGPKMYEITKGAYAKKFAENTQLYQIIDIEENGPAFLKDIVPGTVIKRADRQDVSDVNDILNALEAVQNRGSKALLLLLSDGERERFVAINISK